jgi:hypothetical protein
VNCRLPVAQTGFGNTELAGFISLPSGTFEPDAGSGIASDAGANRTRTLQAPVLYGDGGATYDRTHRRWLPVARVQALPDGSAYVYTREANPTQFRNEIHLVNVATGTDRVIYNQGPYDALTYDVEGVYVTYHLNGTDAAHGLWLLDPTTQSLKAFPSGTRASWAAVAAGGAWSYSVDGNRFGSSSFARLDLATGTVTTWFSVPSPAQVPEPGSKTVLVIGFDKNQHPLVVVYVEGSAPEVWLVNAPGQATKLVGLQLAQFTPQLGATDSRGTWIVGADGVYLFNDSGFHRVASAPPGWTADYTIAGACA